MRSRILVICPSPLMPPKRSHLADLRPVSLSPQAAKAAAQSRSGRGRSGMSPALILDPDHSRLHPGTGAQTTPTFDESLTILGLDLETSGPEWKGSKTQEQPRESLRIPWTDGRAQHLTFHIAHTLALSRSARRALAVSCCSWHPSSHPAPHLDQPGPGPREPDLAEASREAGGCTGSWPGRRWPAVGPPQRSATFTIQPGPASLGRQDRSL